MPIPKSSTERREQLNLLRAHVDIADLKAQFRLIRANLGLINRAIVVGIDKKQTQDEYLRYFHAFVMTEISVSEEIHAARKLLNRWLSAASGAGQASRQSDS